jgi:Pla-1/cef family extracellular lipase
MGNKTMKRLIVSAAIISALGLAGCGGDTLEEIQQATPVDKPFVRIVYDPANAAFSLPNDLAMTPPADFIDMTLNTEGSATFDPANPQHALSALDGWSTHHPFTMSVALPAGQGLTLDAATIGAPGTVRIFEATPVISTNPEPSAACQATAAVLLAPGMPCEIGDELQFGVDFVTTAVGDDTISVVPLKPLKQGQGYIVAVTDSLKDSAGRSVKGSSSWELVAADIAEYPLPLASQTLLQTIVNQMLSLLGTQGVEESGVIYSKYFSVQSVGDVMSVAKQIQIGGFAQAMGAGMPAAQAAQFLPAIVATDAPVPDLFTMLQPTSPLNCGQIVAGVQAGDATAAAAFADAAPLCATKMKVGNITLPYYLSSTNPLGDYWKSACTNGVILQLIGADAIAGLVAAEQVGPNHAMCSALNQFDLDLTSLGMSDPRNLTKFAPIPAKDSDVELTVQITVPDTTVLSLINQAPVSVPENGWPVVVLTHGITSKKEDMLGIAAALAASGYATVAIDQPLHGSRGFTIDNQIINASDGFGGSATDYMNLSSLLTARDNVRQSSLDSMGLRLGLNAVVDMSTDSSVALDKDNVHFFGHSIGAITGTNTVATANTSLGGALSGFDGMYAFKSAILANPGGSIAAFLTESGSFSPLVNSSVAAGGSPSFQAYIPTYMAANGIADVNAAIGPAFVEFMANASAAELAEVNGVIAQFVFAATTILDSADPVNSGIKLAASGTPVYVNLVTGDGGGVNVQDQTVPANLANPAAPLSGGEPLAAVAMGLPQITSTTVGSGYVAFSEGNHSSIAQPGSAVNTEMLTQMIGFISTAGAGSATIAVSSGEGNVIDERTILERKAEIQGQ